jgi:hypothetical protein
MARVVRMNESTSDSFDQVPLPARQQLGYYNEVVDKDARSGNGVDRLREDGSDRRDYGSLRAEDGGSRVHEVTYHLDTTPAPETVRSTQGNATTARQREDAFVSTQREAPGRNERMGAALGIEDHHSAEAGSGKAANTVPSESVEKPTRRTRKPATDKAAEDK